MRGLAFLRGLQVVARHEFLVNMRSARLLIMLAVLALVVVGGAYGFSAGSGGGPTLSPFVAWGHPAIGATTEHIAVVWVSDPFGVPLADRTVTFLEAPQDGGLVGEARTDSDGFARLAVGNRSEVYFTVRSGTAEFSSFVFWLSEPLANFTVGQYQEDLDNDGLRDDLGIHVLTRAGAPAVARLFVNETFVTTVDAHGYGRVELPPGQSNVTVEVAGERVTTLSFVDPDPFLPPFATGPDFVLLIIAGGFAAFAVPIFAIVISFDALSKERVQGTLDLLLSRPVGRAGVLLGKFGGSFAAVAVPATLVNLAAIAILTMSSGKAPTASFAAAFLVLELLLIAFYVPLQLTFSSLAKTGGTAILFGFLVWLAFNVLYPVITSVLSFVLFPNNFEAQFRFSQVAGLGNPTTIYQQLIAFAAPETIGSGFGPFGGTALDLPVVAFAALVWLAVLLGLALWTFNRRAAE